MKRDSKKLDPRIIEAVADICRTVNLDWETELDWDINLDWNVNWDWKLKWDWEGDLNKPNAWRNER